MHAQASQSLAQHHKAGNGTADHVKICHTQQTLMHGCSYHMQADKGNNTSERPMWAEKGGLDFEGRAKWDAWTAIKGMKPEKAKLEFVRVCP